MVSVDESEKLGNFLNELENIIEGISEKDIKFKIQKIIEKMDEVIL